MRRDWCGSDQVDRDVGVAARGFGVRTDLVRVIEQGLRDVARDTRQTDVEAGAEDVAAVQQVEVHLGVDRDLAWQRDLLLASRKRDRAFKTGRPAGGEQLLRISADARRAGGREPDVQAAV